MKRLFSIIALVAIAATLTFSSCNSCPSNSNIEPTDTVMSADTLSPDGNYDSLSYDSVVYIP